jgi:hypothetical protein
MRLTLDILCALPAALFAQGQAQHAASNLRAIVACVVDSAAGTPLDGAVVRVAGTRLGTQTNNVGFAQVRIHAQWIGEKLVDPRIDTIVVERLGYVSRSLPVPAGTDSLLSLGIVRITPVSDRYFLSHGGQIDLVEARKRTITRGMSRRDVCPARLRGL